jgi:hypothetical protein
MAKLTKWALALTLLAPLSAASPASAQTGRDACLDAARALVRQPTSWEDPRDLRRDGLLRWRATDGTWGTCRVDARGMAYEVRVEAWGSGRPGNVWPSPAVSGDFTEEFGFDRRGDDYATLTARTLSGCQMACRDDARCAAYTFSAREAKCWLKTRVNSAQASRDMVTGYRIAGAGDGMGDGWRTLTEEWDHDRRGNDIADFRASGLGECKEECRRDARCHAYTYDTRTRMCYLKDRVTTPQRNDGMVTGYKQGG